MTNKPKSQTIERKAQRAALDRLKSRPISDEIKVLIIRGTDKR